MGFSVNQRNSLRSPHVRGKDTRRQRDDSVRGITPACAGKSRSSCTSASRARDHPRVCGEKNACGCESSILSGLPPRVRGKENGRAAVSDIMGITPACAGKRPKRADRLSAPQDHPRVCREKPLVRAEDGSYSGSPPRVRGKVQSLVDLHIRLKDHPRVCGEKTSACVAGLRRGGSPPRVRGKEPGDIDETEEARITPACAGKRTAALLNNWPQKDHPRVCGEKTLCVFLKMTFEGSPPRVRGKAGCGGVFLYHRRITPACAGKSV